LPRQTELPPSLPPRLVSREVAAAYVCVSPNTFDQMVKEGRMPRPKSLGGRRVAWDVRALDQAVDVLPFEGDHCRTDDTWSDVDAPQAPSAR
jgi:predicted DNA-binding transcriptional regulator AlpA